MTVDEGVGSDVGRDDAAVGTAPENRRRRTVVIIVTAVATLLVALLAIVVFVVSPYTMQGSSMSPTYENGDRVWINRLASPGNGDVVVVEVNALDGREVLKRVVATGGDTVEIENCRVFVNGDLPEGVPPSTGRSSCGGDFGPVTVPDGHLFVLGDNLAGSQDSRQFGAVPASDVVGVALGS